MYKFKIKFKEFFVVLICAMASLFVLPMELVLASLIFGAVIYAGTMMIKSAASHDLKTKEIKKV